ncbi:vesicle-associated protein 2-2 [Andrographis paniculata]|uniref:vesicle-associated protein 2-2 n=1 Tax=Andrographis paniculata TaxID=175694 RepID=UPI0021E864E2|nr:vesicle-associated protein 2-2 [Andrographis paniculata]XP_051127845.1 vesicle-associated protein 2-2 [Andrographis paniculata]
MNPQLVEIHPRELKFIFEEKKQSSCIVHLANVTDHYVAFKVKTTSPKKYCVRPNVGIVKPKSTCDFIVIMQAQKSAPSETQCKDKFLVQTTVVAFGTTEAEITPSMFSKDSQKHIEETKLRVALTTTPKPPAEPPADVILEQEKETSLPKLPPHSSVLLPVNGVTSPESSNEMSTPKEGVENLPPHQALKQMGRTTDNVSNIEIESRSPKVMDNTSLPGKDEKMKQQVKDVEEAKLKLTLDIEELRSKITTMDAKLVEAQGTINKLKEEKSSIIREKYSLERDLAMSRTDARKVQVGFPPLFVCLVALVSLLFGFWFRA